MKLLIVTFCAVIFSSLAIASKNHPHGEAIHVQKFLKHKTDTEVEDVIFIDYQKLYNFLEHGEIKERKIVVLSVIGAYRRGKSFFLDYCLRYLYANYKSINNLDTFNGTHSDWIGSPTEPLTGFSWRSGSSADTQGILFWSDIFLHDAPNDDKIAILIMDTQGLFEPGVSSDLNARIFGLSTLISSIQVINLNGVIQEDQLQYLELSVKFTELIQKRVKNSRNSSSQSPKPFQNLVFLLRDWADEDTGYGYAGGEMVWNEVVRSSSDNRVAENVRKNIKNAFENISTFLLPHPGLEVIKKAFDGSHQNLSEEFVKNLKVLIESLLSPEKLTIKKVFDNQINGDEFKNLVLDYFDAFNSTQTPKVDSLYRITAAREMRKIIDALKVEYTHEIQQLINYDLDLQEFNENLDANNQKVTKKIVTKFQTTSEVSDKDLLDEMTQILADELKNYSQKWFTNIESVYKSFQLKKKEIEKLKLQQKQTKQRLNEERKIFEEEIEQKAKELADLEKKQREDQEKEMRFNLAKLISDFFWGLINSLG